MHLNCDPSLIGLIKMINKSGKHELEKNDEKWLKRRRKNGIKNVDKSQKQDK